MRLTREDPATKRGHIGVRIRALAGPGEVTSAVANWEIHASYGLETPEVTELLVQPYFRVVADYCLEAHRNNYPKSAAQSRSTNAKSRSNYRSQLWFAATQRSAGAGG